VTAGKGAVPYRLSMSLPSRSTLAALLALLVAPALGAQLPTGDGIPAHSPINPSSARRTALFAAPYLAPSTGWRLAVALEYGSAIEISPEREGTRYLLDAELARLQLDASRDIGNSSFVALSVQGAGVHAGLLDAPIDWFHERVGYHMAGRASRPRNRFADTLVLADGTTVSNANPGFQLGDTRLTLGRRHGQRQQTLLSVTLPTSTGHSTYGRGVPSLALVHTLRAPLGSRVLYEGSAGVGYTPAHGALAAFERELLGSASSGLRVRIGDSHALYYFVFLHSPYYRGTGIHELEGSELSQELGWIRRTRGGREWRFGLTEDVVRDDQALDVVFKVSVGW
jgi:hypothetical protein